MTPTDDPIARAAALVRDASGILVLTGAGVSAESGVPTFRGAGGLWRSFRPEQLATPGAFARDPRLVWEWYAWRLAKIAECRPNAAHCALASLALDRPGVRIVTQNVDGLHAEAAHDEAARRAIAPDAAFPLELHGAIGRARCTGCGLLRAIDADDPALAEPPPRCSRCDALLRPDVVWFGEPLDPAVLDEATSLATAADACLVVGTSALVWPAAGLASITRRGGGAVIEVNPEETPLSGEATVAIRAPAAEAVPRILRAWSRM